MNDKVPIFEDLFCHENVTIELWKSRMKLTPAIEFICIRHQVIFVCVNGRVRPVLFQIVEKILLVDRYLIDLTLTFLNHVHTFWQPRSQGLSSSRSQGAGRWETLGTRLAFDSFGQKCPEICPQRGFAVVIKTVLSNRYKISSILGNREFKFSFYDEGCFFFRILSHNKSCKSCCICKNRVF